MLGRSGFDCCLLPERVGGWLIKLISHFWNWMAFPSSNTSASNLDLPVYSGSVLSGEKQASECIATLAGTVEIVTGLLRQGGLKPLLLKS